MGICPRIIVIKCKDKICFQNQLVTEVCIQFGFLWKGALVLQKYKMPLVQMIPDSGLLKYMGKKSHTIFCTARGCLFSR